jgi:hypothetical protein
MARLSPRPLTAAERRARRRRVVRLARELRFVGRIEYRHVFSQTGGAQYARGSNADEDLLTVYAEAFERDADPEDFSLEAILAHERGHQLWLGIRESPSESRLPASPPAARKFLHRSGGGYALSGS